MKFLTVPFPSRSLRPYSSNPNKTMLSFSYLSLLSIAISFPSFVVASPTHGNLHLNHRSKNGETTSNSSIQARQSSNAVFSWYVAGLGACGTTNSASDYIVALNTDQWDGGSHCYEMVTLTYQGKSVQAQITDECAEGCVSGQLDLTEGLFAALSGGDPNVIGKMYGGTWSYGNAPSTTSSSSTSQYTPPSTSQTPTSTPPPSTTRTSSSTSTSTTTSTSTSSSSSLLTSSASTTSTSASASATATSGPQVFSLFQQALIQLAGVAADANIIWQSIVCLVSVHL